MTPIIIKHCETVQDFLQNKPAEPASSSGGADGADGASTAVLGGSSLGAGASKASFGAGGSTGVGATQVVAKEAAEKPKRGADDGDSDSSDGACVRARVLDEESVPVPVPVPVPVTATATATAYKHHARFAWAKVRYGAALAPCSSCVICPSRRLRRRVAV